MIGKTGTLLIIFLLLSLFYLVIAWGAGKERLKNPKIKKYLLNVRALIGIIGVASLILWFFL